MKAIASLFVFFVLLSIPLRSQWVKCESPTGGDVHSITNLGNSLIAGLTGGVYRSTDNGDSWSLVGLKNENVQSVLASGSTLLAGTLVGSYATGDIHRSTDSGKSWSVVKAKLGSSIRCFASLGTTLLAGTVQHGIYQSTDNGQTWTEANAGLKALSLQINAIDVLKSTVFIGTADGVYTRGENDSLWTKSNTGIKAGVTVQTVKVHGEIVYAGTRSGGIYRSVDNGKNWLSGSQGIPTGLTITSIIGSDTTLVVGVQSNFGFGVYRSTDKGDTWTQVKGGVEGLNVTCLLMKGTTFYAGTEQWGVYRSSDAGTSWVQSNTGMPSKGFVSMEVSGSTLIGGTAKGGLFISSDNSAHWVEAGIPFRNRYNYISKSDSGLMVASGNYGTEFYRSVDNGTTWLHNPKAKIMSAVSLLATLGSTIFASDDCCGENLWISSDVGTTWTNWRYAPISNEVVYSFTVNDTSLYVGTSAGVCRVTSNGNVWNTTKIAGLQDKSNPYNYRITALAVLDTFLYAGLGYNFGTFGIYRNSINASSDDTWQPINGGITSSTELPKTTDIKVYESVLYYGTAEGTYYSTTKGDYWREITWDTEHLTTAKFVIKDKTIFAYNAQGVWKLNPATLSANEDTFPSNTAPQLLCYPNPTTNSLTIDRTSLPFTSGAVKYTILSVTGETVYEGEIAEPRLSLPVDALPTGVYSLVARQGMVRTSVVFTVVR